MLEKQINEAVKRMEMLGMSRQCINAFKRGEVWESENRGALYECNEEENKLIQEFEKEYGGKVYHMIHDIYEFGECYTMLFVSKYEEEWGQDIDDLKYGRPLAYVKNISDDTCSEFGFVGIKQNIGGIVRVA